MTLSKRFKISVSRVSSPEASLVVKFSFCPGLICNNVFCFLSARDTLYISCADMPLLDSTLESESPDLTSAVCSLNVGGLFFFTKASGVEIL